jgi:hypothetical protein
MKLAIKTTAAMTIGLFQRNSVFMRPTLPRKIVVCLEMLNAFGT